MSIWSQIASGLRDCDMYAEPVFLTFKGRKGYSSIFGGITTIILKLTFFFIAGYFLKVLVDKEQTEINESKVYSDEHSSFTLNKDNFKVALHIFEYGQTLTHVPACASIKIAQFSRNIQTNEISSKESDMELCNPEDFRDQISSMQNISISSFWCPKSDFEAEITPVSGIRDSQGNKGKVQKEVQIWITQENTCSFYPENYSVFLVNKKFNSESAGMVYSEFQEIHQSGGGYNDFNTSVSLLQKNLLSLSSSIYSLIPDTHDSDFISFNENYYMQYDGNGASDSNTTLRFKHIFVMDEEIKIYEKSTFTLFEYFGLIGGLYEFLRILGSWVVHFFMRKFYLLSLIEELYHSSNEKPDEDKANKEQNQTQNDQNQPQNEQNQPEEEKEIPEAEKAAREAKRQLAEKAQESMKARSLIEFTYKGFLVACYHASMFKCLIKKLLFCDRQNHFSQEFIKENNLFKSGKERLNVDKDIRNIVRANRELVAIANCLLDSNQKLLLAYQNEYVFNPPLINNGKEENEHTIPIPPKNCPRIYSDEFNRQIEQITAVLENQNSKPIFRITKGLSTTKGFKKSEIDRLVPGSQNSHNGNGGNGQNQH